MFTLEEVVRTLWLVDLVHQNSSSSFPPHQQFFSFGGGGKWEHPGMNFGRAHRRAPRDGKDQHNEE